MSTASTALATCCTIQHNCSTGPIQDDFKGKEKNLIAIKVKLLNLFIRALLKKKLLIKINKIKNLIRQT